MITNEFRESADKALTALTEYAIRSEVYLASLTRETFNEEQVLNNEISRLLDRALRLRLDLIELQRKMM